MNTPPKLRPLLEFGNLIASRYSPEEIIEKILHTSMQLLSADGCLFYTINEDKFLTLSYSSCLSLHLTKHGAENLAYMPTVFLPEIKKKTPQTLAASCFFTKSIINCDNIYRDDEYDNQIFTAFDQAQNYATVSVLTVPIITPHENIIGIVQFTNTHNDKGLTLSFTGADQKIAVTVCNIISLILENKILNESYEQLLESFIEVLARAIDAKSPYTGAHCQRVPVIAKLLATAAVQETEGALSNFEMSENDWYTLHIASWLHDCGKVTTPEYIVDKATKLETIYNRIHEIRQRFEILRRDAHITYLQKRLANYDSQENLQAEFVSRIKQLEKDFDFVAQCNIGDKIMTETDYQELERISQQTFTRYFSRIKGISWAERDHIEDKQLYDNPHQENLLQDREDLLFDHYNRGELYNLKIPRGTINKEEREKINEHIVVTIDMLKALPFPKELSKVVEYAGAHHERVDGKGYPNGLTGEQMSVPAKIMAIADIFEALTANDRPYKEPKKLSEVLRIMQKMKNTGHIDPDLYRVFITQKVYLEYAEQYINKAQIDNINPNDFL